MDTGNAQNLSAKPHPSKQQLLSQVARADYFGGVWLGGVVQFFFGICWNIKDPISLPILFANTVLAPLRAVGLWTLLTAQNGVGILCVIARLAL